MHIVIYGTGGVGGYFGARLAQIGQRVTFIARGTHLEAIQKNGLQLKSDLGDYLVNPATVTDAIDSVKDIDLILICVKTWQLAEAANAIKDVMDKETMVISLLNGVENDRILCDILNKSHVLGGLCKIVSKVESPGIINHMSYEPTIVFGELNNKPTQRAMRLKRTFLDAGITTKLAEDIQREIWTKFLFITTISALGALTRTTVGQMLTYPFIKDMMYKTAEEIVMVAKKLGVQLKDDIIEKQFELIESQPFNTTASLQRDMMNGKPSELEAQNGTVVKLAKELGLEVPVNSFIYHSLLPQENRSRS